MDITLFLIFFAACVAAGTTGAMFPPGSWYQSLNKPNWVPPNWVFPVVWSTLYVFMSVAGARIAVLDGNSFAMAFWALQIALNTLWTPIFFGLRRLRGGMIVIVALWISVAACVWFSWQLDWLSGLLLAPYLLWVSIAAALNFSVMRLNPDVEPVA